MRSTLPLVEEARGRCHSCSHKTRYDIPSGSRVWCRAWGVEMTEERSRRVKQCRRWGGIKVPAAPSLQQLGGDSLLTELIDQEDHLFAQLKYYLEDVEVDLKSVVIIARPHLIDQVDWIDSLDSRFDGMPEIGAAELLDRLASSGYRDIVSIVRPLILI